MSAEVTYPFDEAPGLYGYQSHERLARNAIKSFGQNQRAQAASELVDDFANPHRHVASIGEFRLSSLVRSNEDNTGWALAVAPIDKLDEVNMSGLLFRVNRYGSQGRGGDPEIDMATPIPVIRSETARTPNRDSRLCKKEMNELMLQFSKVELEVLVRTLGKMTKALDIADEIKDMDDEDSLYADLGTISRMKALNEVLRSTTRMKTSAAVEPRVLRALQSYRSGAAGILLSGAHSRRQEKAVDNTDRDGDVTIEHISEWHGLLKIAKGVLQREADPSQAVYTVALQHEIDTSHYMINLRSEYGELTGIQLLREDIGAIQVQTFDLVAETDEDDIDKNRVGPAWDRAAIVECAVHGIRATDETYEAYRSLAEANLGRPVGNLVDLDEVRKRRRAA